MDGGAAPQYLATPWRREDPAFSEYYSVGDGLRDAASERYVGAAVSEPLARPRGWPRAEGPIAVEIVRGAEGDSDRWTLLVDGIKAVRVGDHGFALPPPRGARRGLRQLAVAARLEGESKAPEKVELVAETVLVSSERATDARRREDPPQEAGREAVGVYAPRDTLCKPLVACYPWSVPPPPVLGIARYQTKKLADKSYIEAAMGILVSARDFVTRNAWRVASFAARAALLAGDEAQVRVQQRIGVFTQTGSTRLLSDTWSAYVDDLHDSLPFLLVRAHAPAPARPRASDRARAHRPEDSRRTKCAKSCGRRG